MGVASLSRRGLSGDWIIRGRGLEVTWQLWTNQKFMQQNSHFYTTAVVATIDMGLKQGVLCPFRGALGTRLIQCGLCLATIV